MKRIFIVLAVVSLAFSSFEFVEKARFDFGEEIDRVKRHYFIDRWIHEVRCGDIVYILDGWDIDTNHIEGIADGAVLVCGDSVMALTKSSDTAGFYCSFHKIYPDNAYIGTREGLNFDFCVWSDSLGEVLYILNYHSVDSFDGGLEIETTVRSSFFSSLELDAVHVIGNANIVDAEYFPDGVLILFSNFRYYRTYDYGYIEFYNYNYELNDYIWTKTDITLKRFSAITGNLGMDIPYTVGGGAYYELESNQTTVGKSMLDFNGDELIDLPYNLFQTFWFREDGGAYGEDGGGFDTVAYYNAIHLSGHDDLRFERNSTELFAGHFIDSVTPCFLSGDILYFGDSLQESIIIPDVPHISDISDIDNDGIHELLGYDEDNVLRFYSLSLKPSLQVKQGWNMLAPPFYLADSTIADIMPFAIPAFYHYLPEIRNYTELEYFQPGKSVYAYSTIDTVLDITGEPVESVTLELKRGWNMVGGLSRIVYANEFHADSLLVMPVYLYNTALNRYTEAPFILPWQGFWLLATEDHELILD